MDGAPLVHDEAPNNLAFDWELGDKAKTDAALADAHHITTLEFINQRLAPNAIEPRSAIGYYDNANDKYTLYTSSQNPHLIRLLMCAFVLGIPEHKVRVVSPDVGGGFGSKIFHYIEEALVTWCSRQIGRPVKWTADRSESFMTDCHGRDHVTKAELGLRCRRQFCWPQDQNICKSGSIPFYFWTLCSYLFAWDPPAGFVYHSGYTCRCKWSIYPYHSCGCLSWSRTTRSHLFA